MPDSIIMDDYDSFSGDPFSIGEPPPESPVFVPPPEGIVPLGYDHGVFYYLSQGNRQVVAVAAGAHNRTVLTGIASAAHYWERQTQFATKTGIDWHAAIDWLMSQCRAQGVFDPDRLRGRGAWMDGDRAVLHVGDQLIVDGEVSPLLLPGSRYVYEAARPLGTHSAAPLSSTEAHKLVGICQRLRWERGLSGTLMAGFLALAPVCGGLAWRSSCWLVGGSGTGKSWINTNIVHPILAGTALMVQSKTSEAGIRQALGTDARPVVFDEIEAEDQASAARVQGVLDLVRQSSSETGGAIVKGSQNQTGARSFRIRSMFWLSSINAAIAHQADESRITMLALRPAPAIPGAAELAKFDALNADVVETITPAFAAGLVARSVRLLPVIRKNTETFARAIALHLGSRRLGDQIGTLLAGAYSLHTEREISPAEAESYVQREDWTGAVDDGEQERDERKLLTHITQSRVKVSPGNGAPIEITIGRLIEAAWGGDERIAADVAETELRASGVRCDAGEGVFISTNHPALKRLLFGTPWSAGWSRALGRLPGAERGMKAIRFGPMHVSKSVWISRRVLEGEEK